MKFLGILLLCLAVVFPARDGLCWSVADETGTILDVGGHMQYRGRYYDLDFKSDGEADQAGSLNRHNYYGDLSLTFGITPNQNVKAFFEFNRLIFFGQQYRYNTIQTGEAVKPENFTLPDGTVLPLRQNTDEAWELHMRQAWLDVKFPGADMRLKFGRQPFILGNGIYTNTNIASVFGYQFYTTLGEGRPSFRAGSMKYFEGVRENYNGDLQKNDADDIDLFFGDLSIPVNKSKVGAFLTYFRDNSQLDNVLSHVNLGLTANLSFEGGWTVRSEFDYQNGSKSYGGATSDLDWTGTAFMLNVGLPPLADKKVMLSVEYGRGSGDDPATADKFEGYVGVGPFYPYAWAYEYRFIHWIHNSSKFFAGNSRGMAENLAPGLENTTYIKPQVVFVLPKGCRFISAPIWLGMTQQGESFGWEWDNVFIAPVWKNFSYTFIFSAIAPSDWMKDRGFDDLAYGIRSQLEVKF